MPRYSAAEVAERLGTVDKEAAHNLIRFLCAARLAEKVGQRRTQSGMGAPENVYAFHEDFDKDLAKILRKADLT